MIDVHDNVPPIPVNIVDAEEARVRSAYERRELNIPKRRYSYFDLGNLFTAQERRHHLVARLFYQQSQQPRCTGRRQNRNQRSVSELQRKLQPRYGGAASRAGAGWEILGALPHPCEPARIRYSFAGSDPEEMISDCAKEYSKRSRSQRRFSHF